MNMEDDRISNLPDDLIHKILSFIGTKHVVQTSALSSKWRFIWTKMLFLNFSTKDLDTLPKFSNFVTQVLSHLNNQIDVSSVNLSFGGKASQVFVTNMLNYALSHNIQQLTVKSMKDDTEFSLSLLTSQSLKHFSMTGYRRLTSTWELPALTTLYLYDILLYDDEIGLFSKCTNLKIITLNQCRTTGSKMGSGGFNICHSRLSSLTIIGLYCNLNIVAPQLKNLNIRGCDIGKSLKFSADSVRLLEKVDLFCNPLIHYVEKFIVLLQQMHNVKFLSLRLEFVELLCSCVELIPDQPSPFSNLKSLRIYPLYPNIHPMEKVDMSIKVKNYLLGSSQSATFTLVSREEIKAAKNTPSAQIQKIMDKLRGLLKQDKTHSETSMTHFLQRNTQPETEMQLQIGGSVEQVDDCWDEVCEQFEYKKGNARHIIKMLQSIRDLLTKLPASNRAMIQPRFSRICAEADIVLSKLTDCMKIQCNENISSLSVCFHEFATSLLPSS